MTTLALNEEQQAALDHVLQGKNIFLTGPGGVGKSFLIQRIVETLQERKKRVAVTALTGCAALLLGKDAKTIHSWAGIGIGRDPAQKLVADILKYKFKIQKNWLLTNTLIVDEVSMLTPAILELLNEVGKKVRRDSRPFGGIQLLFVGDFFQLPPVLKQEELEAGALQFAFESPLWNQLNFYPVVLKQLMRQADPKFQDILQQARWGRFTKEAEAVLRTRENLPWDTLEIKPTLLFSRRAEVELLNQRHLQTLEGPKEVFEAKTVFDSTVPKKTTEASQEAKYAISKLDRDAPYRTSLELKVGAQVMLIYNEDQEEGLVNGSRGVVKGFTDTVPKLPLVLFNSTPNPIPIGYRTWKSEDIEGLGRSQIPLIVAYAITIHKCQGATLDSALIDIGPTTFETGQAYVALSRVKSLESLYLYDFDRRALKAHPKVVAFYQSLESTS